jgi:O-antigen/teichoic acid export membrane protein
MLAYVSSEGGARALSFLYYLVAARVLSPEGFGVLRYSITVALLIFGPVQTLCIALNRELGAARGSEERTRAVVGTALAVAGGVLVITMAVAAVATALGLTGTADLAGMLAVLAGTAAFQLYYSVARGVGDTARGAMTYVGASFAQLVAFGALAIALDPSPTVALMVFGGSSIVPIALLELRRPLLFRRALAFRRTEVRALWTIGAPLLAAQVGFLVWTSADQIWVEQTLGAAEIGIYSAAKNLSQLFIVLPAGVNAVLLPRIAELATARDAERARMLLFFYGGALLVASAALAAVISLAREPLLEFLYGSEYVAAGDALVGLSAAMAIYAGYVIFTNGAVGWGRPGVYTVTILIAAACEVGALLVIDSSESAAAAWAFAGSGLVALVVVVAWLLLRPLQAEEAAGPRVGSDGTGA